MILPYFGMTIMTKEQLKKRRALDAAWRAYYAPMQLGKKLEYLIHKRIKNCKFPNEKHDEENTFRLFSK